MLNSETFDIFGHEGDSDDEVLRECKTKSCKQGSRSINNMLAEDWVRIEAMLESERVLRERFHQRTREEEQRRGQASAAGNLPPGETAAVPGSSGHSSSGEIPDVPIEQEIKM